VPELISTTVLHIDVCCSMHSTNDGKMWIGGCRNRVTARVRDRVKFRLKIMISDKAKVSNRLGEG